MSVGRVSTWSSSGRSTGLSQSLCSVGCQVLWSGCTDGGGRPFSMSRMAMCRWAELMVGGAVGVTVVVACGSAVGSDARGSSAGGVRRCAQSQWPPAASRPRSGAAEGATAGFGLFRRPGGQADQLPAIDKPLGQELGTQLGSYDPALTRGISATPPAGVGGAEGTYVVAGQGAAPQTEIENMPCAQRLSLRERRQLEAAFRSIRAITPSGPAFCLLSVAQLQGQSRGHLSLRGGCETFADAARGFGAIQASIVGGPFLQGLVPDGVSSVLLHYRRHAAIRARVSENAFWAWVPRSPPLASGPDPAQPARVRRAVLEGLPTSVAWLAPDGHTLRVFSPPRAYVRRLIRRYQACRAMHCGR